MLFLLETRTTTVTNQIRTDKLVGGVKSRNTEVHASYPRHPVYLHPQVCAGPTTSQARQLLIASGPGQLLRGAVDDNGKNKAAALMVGIKMDLEAEVHLTARIKGDIAIGLY